MDGSAEGPLDATFEAPALAAALSPLEQLMRGVGTRLDRFVFENVMRRRRVEWPHDGDRMAARLARARAFYAEERFVSEPGAFFAPPGPLRARLTPLRRLPGGELVDVHFAADFLPVLPEARADIRPVRGIARWWRHRTPGHPAMLCIHGYGGGHLWLEALAFEAWRFYRSGLDVLLYVLPYHGLRSPAGAHRSGAGFFGVDLVRTNEAFAQAIFELRALHAYARAHGAGAVGAFGMSLGAYTTALLAALEPALAFAVAMVPLASLADMMWATSRGDARVARAAANGWDLDALRAFFRVHAPLVRPSLVPRERRLVIAALGDRICPPAHADALWRHWDRPRIHWYPGGHLAQFRRSRALREVRTLLRDARLLPSR